MAHEITGKIFAVLAEQSGQGQNGPWVKQAFVIETPSDRFPKKICFQAWNDKGEIVTRLKPGDEVKVFFDAESREFNGKWYTDLRVWKMEVVNASTSTSTSQPTPAPSSEELSAPLKEDDLPF